MTGHRYGNNLTASAYRDGAYPNGRLKRTLGQTDAFRLNQFTSGWAEFVYTLQCKINERQAGR